MIHTFYTSFPRNPVHSCWRYHRKNKAALEKPSDLCPSICPITGRLFASEMSNEDGSISVWRHQGYSCYAAKPYVAPSVSLVCSDILTGLVFDHTGHMFAVFFLKGHYFCFNRVMFPSFLCSTILNFEKFKPSPCASNKRHVLLKFWCFLLAASADRSIAVWNNHGQ